MTLPTPTCQHGEHEDCMICSVCGKCSESLDDNDVCADCKATPPASAKKKSTAYDVGNQFGYICPACSSGEHLEICALVWVALSPDGSDPGEAWDGSQEWTEKSAVTCRACAWSGLVKELKKVEVED